MVNDLRHVMQHCQSFQTHDAQDDQDSHKWLFILMQISAKAGLKKHGFLVKEVLLKVFMQFNDLDVMMSFDPTILPPAQMKSVLGC